MDLIAGAAARGTTVLVATHDHALVERYGRRTLRLEGGRLIEDLRGRAAVTRARRAAPLLRALGAALGLAREPDHRRRSRSATIAVPLLLVGAFALLLSNMSACSSASAREVRLTAYLDARASATRASASSLRRRRSGVAGVESAEWVSRSGGARALPRSGFGGEPRCSTGSTRTRCPPRSRSRSRPTRATPGRRSKRVAEALAGAAAASPSVGCGHAGSRATRARSRSCASAALALGARARARHAADRLEHDPPRGLRAARRDRDPRAGRRAAAPSSRRRSCSRGCSQGAVGGCSRSALLALELPRARRLAAGRRSSFVLGYTEPAFFGAGAAGALVGGGRRARLRRARRRAVSGCGVRGRA